PSRQLKNRTHHLDQLGAEKFHQSEIQQQRKEKTGQKKDRKKNGNQIIQQKPSRIRRMHRIRARFKIGHYDENHAQEADCQPKFADMEQFIKKRIFHNQSRFEKNSRHGKKDGQRN